MNKLILFLLLSVSLVTLNACTPIVIGGIGAVGGYMASNDTVKGQVDYSDVDVWDAAVEVIEIMGLVESRNEAAGELIANVQGAHVVVTVIPMDKNRTDLSVKARENLLPDVRLAQEIFIKIMNHLIK